MSLPLLDWRQGVCVAASNLMAGTCASLFFCVCHLCQVVGSFSISGELQKTRWPLLDAAVASIHDRARITFYFPWYHFSSYLVSCSLFAVHCCCSRPDGNKCNSRPEFPGMCALDPRR